MWLKQVDTSSDTFLNLFDTNWFGPWRPWLRSILSLLVSSSYTLPGAPSSPKHFKCMFAAIGNISDGLTALRETETR